MKSIAMIIGMVVTGPVPTLINGVVADLKDWPASVRARSGNAGCSATVVGEKALLIAAHCVRNGATATFQANNKSYSARCEHSPHYRGNSTADWALCLVSQPVTGIKFENVNIEPDLVALGDSLTLTGYGCTGRNSGSDSRYRIGTATVTRLPSGNNNDIVTRGGAALCFGDSGGPAFAVNESGVRWLVGVNSRGDISTMSYLSATHTAQAMQFINSWAQKHNAQLCGVTQDAVECRGTRSEPAEFEIESKSLALQVIVQPEHKALPDSIRFQLQVAIESMEK